MTTKPKEKKIRVKFLRDAVADKRDFLKDEVADIPFDDAMILAQRWNGRSPSVLMLSDNI